MRRERREVKKTELFHERNQNLRIWKILSLLRLQKWESLCIESNQGVIGQPSADEIRLWLTDPVNPCSRNWKQGRCYPGQMSKGSSCLVAWPPENCMGSDKVLENLHRQRHCQLKLNRDRITEGSLLDFWEATGWASRAVWLPTCIIHREKGMILKTKQTSAGVSLSHGRGRGLSLLSSWEWAPLLWLHPGPRGWGRRPAGPGDRARSQRELSLSLR